MNLCIAAGWSPLRFKYRPVRTVQLLWVAGRSATGKRGRGWRGDTLRLSLVQPSSPNTCRWPSQSSSRTGIEAGFRYAPSGSLSLTGLCRQAWAEWQVARHGWPARQTSPVHTFLTVLFQFMCCQAVMAVSLPHVVTSTKRVGKFSGVFQSSLVVRTLVNQCKPSALLMLIRFQLVL